MTGVFAPQWTEPMAEVLGNLGLERAWVVHAHDGSDELTTTGPAKVSELKDGKVTTYEVSPMFGKKNPRPYKERGWCAFEFSVAEMSDNIIDTSGAREVRRSRQNWPRTVKDFQKLFTEELKNGKLFFTNGADVDPVSFAFFRACFNIRGDNA